MADEEVEVAVEAGAAGGGGKQKSSSMVMVLVVMSVLIMLLTPVITVVAIKKMVPQTPENMPTDDKDTEVVLSDVMANVHGTNGTRYVKAKVVVTVTKPELQQVFEDQSDTNTIGRRNRVVAIINEIFSSKNLNELLSKEAKDKLKKELKDELNKIVQEVATEGMVKEVYFPDFLIQ